MPCKKDNEIKEDIICRCRTQTIWATLETLQKERFMNILLLHLKTGVMLGVGAVFKFYSGTDEKRCPEWIQKHHLEFVYRIQRSSLEDAIGY